MVPSDLHEQLRRLGVSRGLKPARSRPRRRRKPIEALLPGEIIDTRYGPYFLHRETYQLDHSHGNHTLSDLLRHDRQSTAKLARDNRLAGVEFQRMAFVDTETTGLAGGTGTYAFLVGVGVFDADGFTIHQFFMRDFAEEQAQLQALWKEALEEAVRIGNESPLYVVQMKEQALKHASDLRASEAKIVVAREEGKNQTAKALEDAGVHDQDTGIAKTGAGGKERKRGTDLIQEALNEGTTIFPKKG